MKSARMLAPPLVLVLPGLAREEPELLVDLSGQGWGRPRFRKRNRRRRRA